MKKNQSFLVLIISMLMLSTSSCTENPFKEAFFKETTNSTNHFKYQEDKIVVGTIYNFQISNNDRSYVKQVSLYIADTNRIEAFKIYPQSSETYLVVAEIDWNLFSIKKIHQIEIEEDLSRKKTIEMHLLDSQKNTYLMNNDMEIAIGHFPAFNHGYDFSDLNFVFRHLINPKSNIEVGIVAPIQSKMAYTGKMLLTYEGEEICNNHECYKYSLSGKGISEKEGYLLVNKEFGYFEYMELDANYHRYMDFFRYELLSVSTMNQAEWETFVIRETENYFSRSP